MEKMSDIMSSIPEPAAAILGAWQSTLRQRASDPAIFAADGTTLRTFGAIEEEADELDHRWPRLPERSIVAVAIGNSPAWPAVFLALLRRGLITLPLGADLPVPSFATAVVRADGVLHLNPDAAPPEKVECLLDGTALLKLTSGTTGAPRAIRFTAAQLAADCHQICTTMGITPRDVNYGAIPFAHSYGFSNLVTPLLLAGVPLVATEDRLPRAIAEGLRSTRATVFPGTPTLFHHLAAIDLALPHLRLCISAGAPLSRAVWEAFHGRFGLRLHTFYGSSECGGISYDRAGDMIQEGFVGESMDGVRLELEGDSGQFSVHSAAAGLGYFPDHDPDNLGDGVFRPSDQLRRVPSGWVMTGRLSEFINVGGRKLNPLDVERCLAAFPGIRQNVVFGVASRLRGEEPVACVVGEVEPAEVLRFAAQRLPAWQVPKDVWLLPTLPVSERGKVSRRTLAEHYLSRDRSMR